MHKNLYTPTLMKIIDIRIEAPDVRTFKLEFIEQEEKENFKNKFRTGMFGMYGLFGEGESTFCIASPETQTDYIECTFRKTGRVTSALSRCDIGDLISFRGPYGNHFPVNEFEGKNLLFVAGGIGLPPTRSVIRTCLDRREKFGDITIIYGARTVDDLVYKHELSEWEQRDDVKLVLTVDPGGENSDWKHKIGFVPAILDEHSPLPDNCIAIICGPPIMIKFTLMTLAKLGFPPENIYTTLENRMKCGIGKCGRCNVGPVYVCKEGPVFTAKELESLPASEF